MIAYIAGLAVWRLVGAVALTVRLLLAGLRPNVVNYPSRTRLLLLSVPICLLWLLRLLVSSFQVAKCITNDPTVSFLITGTSALVVFLSISGVVLLVRHVWEVDEFQLCHEERWEEESEVVVYLVNQMLNQSHAVSVGDGQSWVQLSQQTKHASCRLRVWLNSASVAHQLSCAPRRS